MTLTYDDDADVLYLTLEDVSGPCTYKDNKYGDVFRIDTKTGRIVGCTIVFFLDRVRKSGPISIPEIGSLQFSEKVLDSMHA